MKNMVTVTDCRPRRFSLVQLMKSSSLFGKGSLSKIWVSDSISRYISCVRKLVVDKMYFLLE